MKEKGIRIKEKREKRAEKDTLHGESINQNRNQPPLGVSRETLAAGLIFSP